MIDTLEEAWRRGELSLATLQRVHCAIGDISAELKGRLRDGAAIVRLDGQPWFIPPPAAEARCLAGVFLATLANELANERRSRLALAAAAIARLTDLHPFPDGNGRVARAVATWILVRSGHRPKRGASLDRFFHTHRHESYAALRHHDHDHETWTAFFERATLDCFDQGPA